MEIRITDRQREVLQFMREFYDRHGVPPTVREIGARLEVTPRAAFDHLRALERKGYLRRRAGKGRPSRALTVAGGSAGSRGIPILGRIVAGSPLMSEEHRDGEIPLATDWFGNSAGDLFGLRVKGDSMVGAHICEGDLVVVRRQDHASPGDIVVAAVDGEATVKRFAREREAIVLRPENPTLSPIVVRPGEGEVRILGKVVGLVRGL